MATNSKETEAEVDPMVEQFRVCDDVARGLGQGALVTHDTHQVDALHHYL